MNTAPATSASTETGAALTVFMLVKTRPEWLAMPGETRIQAMHTHLAPLLREHAARVALRIYDIEFYSARVSDLWMWEASDHAAYQALVEALRDTPIWDRYFEIVEILPGVENRFEREPALEA